ncbi:iron-siderophore ABC transporter substrate-binding protein [Chlorogloeopsis sp. ULAP02]|uniref:iron-siderophore ABC transporter substrate-binding protein n=1 Tax=Chlorogloeopsis sp. ULAP02 TaxID=3107926 RepID=UPI0031369340
MIFATACGVVINNQTTSLWQPLKDCRLIKHVMGETCIPKNPNRIVTVSQFTLGNLLVLGLQPIAGASALTDLNGFPSYLEPYTKNVAKLGNQYEPSLEKIALLQPDLILGWEAIRKVYPLLSQISPTAVVTWKGTSSWKEHFQFLAQALGKEEEYQKAWERYFQRIKELKTALNNRYKDKKISVISFGSSYGIISWVKSSFPGSILNDIGLQQPKAQDIILPRGDRIYGISEERLQEVNGDIIFILTLRERDSKKLEQLQNKTLWKTLKAVQQGQVYTVDVLTWLGSNLIAADAVIDDIYRYLVNTP